MTQSSEIFPSDEIHPIDIVESLAEYRSWAFDRMGENQIVMTIKSNWNTYSITLAWARHDETLRLACSFEFKAPENRLADLTTTIQQINDENWIGGFTLWRNNGLMVYRYALTLAGGATAGEGQIDAMMRSAVEACECYYPTFQLVVSGETPERAIAVAISDAYGRA